MTERSPAKVKVEELRTEELPPAAENGTTTADVAIPERDRQTLEAVLAAQVRVAAHRS